MNKRSTIWLFVLLVFAAPLTAFAIMSWYEKKIEKLPVLGENKNHRIGNFSLTNQAGEKVTAAKWNGKILVTDFFFTHCPSICPKMTKNMKQLQGYYTDDTLVQFASFTVDPERDSASQLKTYTLTYGLNTKNWDLMTGSKKEIYQLARNSFMIVAADGDGGPEDFIHSEKFVLVDKDKKIRGYYDGTSQKEVNQLKYDIKKLKYED